MSPGPIQIVRLLVCWCLTLALAVACIVLSVVGLPRQAWVAFCRPWARAVLWLLSIEVRVVGTQNLVGPTLFVINHASMIDVVFLPAILPTRVRWVAKQELSKIPFWGWAFQQSGAIFIDRSAPRRAIKTIRSGLERLPPGWSIVIFPEGTRSEDGNLKPLKKGVVHMAMQSRMNIVTVGSFGAHAVTPPGAWVPRPGVIEVTASAPIATGAWTSRQGDEHLAELSEALHDCWAASRRRYLAHSPDPFGASPAEAESRGAPGVPLVG